MNKIQINNWSSYQSYKDRKPPWIRFHKTMLDNFEYHSMSADARAFLPMLWLLASEHEDPTAGVVDVSAKKIAFRLRMSEDVVSKCLDELQVSDFIRCNETVTSPLQVRNETVTPETEAETETETETENAYAFNGDVVKVSQKDFDKWQETFDLIPDLKSFLYAKDLYYASLPEKERKQWFFRISNLLLKEQEKYALEKRELEAQEAKEADFKERQEEFRKNIDWDADNKKFEEGLQ